MSENNKAVVDIDRSVYDIKDVENEQDFYRMEDGFTEEIVRKISEEKHDPE